ncbi:hypothetical protein LTQ56_05600 [Mycobacterium intracellulare subsp. intracellulare]|uniref:hypothetical protein n=1 Tax=Mycobacterium intracellulare TaxID=1767 RepID=UPI0001B45755|nr:hypothetical protein [Mycobacterium intracellulare]UGU08148.1 hypothetical protein LTQ56_05600 [Mycobacterium intracellulare subsp. intracellulare]BCO57170.1 hypothetical protein MINTM005_24140 [Mycobacterium intracellulare]BCO94274.1 hypothetical protein MINTM016_22500 [Mycobacterium intracellulare]
MAEIADTKKAMSNIRASFAKTCDSIRTDSRFTEDGRRRELAKTLLAHRKQAAALRDDTTLDNDTTRAKMMTKVFGLPAGADAGSTLAYRDAVDRAAQLRSGTDLKSMRERATAMGDDLLARAAAARAFELGIRDVAKEYAEATGLDDAYDDLVATPTSSMASAALFSVPTPTELRAVVGGVSDDMLQRIADGDS